MQRHRVVYSVPEEGHVLSGTTRDLDDARLLIGADPGEYRRDPDRRLEVVVVERLDLDAAENPRAVDPDLRAHLGRDQPVVPGNDLYLDAQPLELRDGGAGVGLGPVGERQEALQRQSLLV